MNLNSHQSPARPARSLRYRGGKRRITSCSNTARKNWVSGARHVLRLVDGSLGNVPLRPTLLRLGSRRFHSGLGEPGVHPGRLQQQPGRLGGGRDRRSRRCVGHAAAAAIADAVTLLSDAWTDMESMQTGMLRFRPGTGTANTAFTGWQSQPGRTGLSPIRHRLGLPTEPDIGTDGGVHNFLRFLEDWGGITAITRARW